VEGLRSDLEASNLSYATQLMELRREIMTLEGKLGLSRLMNRVEDRWVYKLETPTERKLREQQEQASPRQRPPRNRNRKSPAGSPGGSTATATASRSRT
jgi:hypothetical protein